MERTQVRLPRFAYPGLHTKVRFPNVRLPRGTSLCFANHVPLGHVLVLLHHIRLPIFLFSRASI